MLAENVVHFTRVLRAGGMAAGPDRALAALAALQAVGIERREDVHAALSATLLDRHEQQPLFDAAFAAFWRDPKLLEQLMHLMLPKVRGRADQPARNQRLAEALSPPKAPPEKSAAPPPADEEQQFDAALSFSGRERLQRADFETMSVAEFRLAQQLAERAPLPVQPVQRRRREAATRGALDLRASLRASLRQPHTLLPARSAPKRELPPLVLLLDISGSMERYSRVLLHYAHGLTRRHVRVHTFTFGTRLTNISRALRQRDPDEALARADALVDDWKGGTRIAASLDDFNRHWARRTLSGNAALLLVTDGLDRDEAGELSRAAAQLKRYARQLVWLNPLLRYAAFQPKAAGVKALLPYVDHFLPVHNLQSLHDLGLALAQAPRRMTASVWRGSGVSAPGPLVS
jgi:uncharacterized protein with von Willebrand factor type A (vWA) domain